MLWQRPSQGSYLLNSSEYSHTKSFPNSVLPNGIWILGEIAERFSPQSDGYSATHLV
jgi:hypothetical protein